LRSDEFVSVDGLKIRYWSNSDETKNSVKNKLTVVLFHGNAFSLDNWRETKTLDSLTKAGYPTYAIDLPAGRGSKSDKVDEAKFHNYRELVPTVERIFAKLGIAFRDLVLVGPSMGGGFAVAYSVVHTQRVQALVLLSPALQLGEGEKEELAKLEIPVLLLWGDSDTLSPVGELGRELKNILSHSKLVILKDAGHAAYLEKPSEFNEILLDFLGEIS
jgi:abhydrolase domain-containing protein 14